MERTSPPEGSLREKEVQYRALFDLIPDFLILAGEGHIVDANRAACQILGRSLAELRGRSLDEFVTPHDTFRSLVGEYSRTGSAHRNVFLTRYEGGTLPCALQMVGVDSSDRNLDTLVVARDITEHLETEKALQEAISAAEANSRDLAAILEYIPEGITICDADFIVRHVSRHGLDMLDGEQSGFSLQEIIERWEVFREDGVTPLPVEETPIMRAMNSVAKVFDQEVVQYSPTGQRMHLLCNAGPILDSEGNVAGAIVTWRNITDRLHTEQELRNINETLERRVHERTVTLEQRNRELQSFAFASSHDLQEPLRKIQTLASMLRLDLGEGYVDEAMRNAARIETAAARMAQQLRDVLSFTGIFTRTEPFESVRLKTTLQLVLSELDLSPGDDESIQTDIEEGLKVLANRNHLHHLIGHLLLNALKFRSPDRPLRVSLRATSLNNGFARIVVEDNGIGFEPRFADRIFEPFQRLHSPDVYPGTGLGLAICRHIVELHGGTMTATGEPGSGARIVLVLPVAAP